MNLKAMSAQIVPQQIVSYSAFVSRSENDLGKDVAVFADSVEVTANVQPVQRSVYEQLGLNLQKEYVTIFTTYNMGDVARDRTGDKFVFQERTYQIESKMDWTSRGWDSALAVRIDD